MTANGTRPTNWLPKLEDAITSLARERELLATRLHETESLLANLLAARAALRLPRTPPVAVTPVISKSQ